MKVKQPASVTVFGLGLIGELWAQHWYADGVLAAAWNRTPREEFPQWMSDPATAAKKGDLLVIVVADPNAVSSIFERILPILDFSKIVVQASTIDPASSANFSGMVKARGAGYIESPFTGSKPGAQNRKTVFYQGGDAGTISAAEKLLSLISSQRMHIGSEMQAATLKLALNMQIAAQNQILVESLHFSRQAGISDDRFFDALRSNAAWSGVTALKEPKLRDGDYSVQFSIKHMLKDLRLALASQNEGDSPVCSATEFAFSRAASAGFQEEDLAALIKVFEPEK